jgi:prepilin-type N-terminal cleavage/methylation domain-containing protein
MRRPEPGFTLLEVLIALIVITIGLLGLAGTLGPVSRLAGEGRARGRAALALASRADLLRAQLLAGAPACAPPGSGSRQHPDGVIEVWSTTTSPGGIEARIWVGRDTLVTRFPCP